MRVEPTARALIVVSRFNEGVTRRLLDGARAALGEAGYDDGNTTVVWVSVQICSSSACMCSRTSAMSPSCGIASKYPGDERIDGDANDHADSGH